MWFNPSWQLSPTQLLTHSPHVWIGERIRRVKERKFMCWDKDSLIAKAKAIYASKVKQGLNSLLPQAGWCSAIPRRARLHHTYQLLVKTNVIPPSFFPQLCMFSMMPYGMEYSFDQLGSTVPAVSSPNSLCTLTLLPSGAVWEAEKALRQCKPCSAITETSLYYQHCFQHKSKTQPSNSYCEENLLYPSQNQHNLKIPEMLLIKSWDFTSWIFFMNLHTNVSILLLLNNSAGEQK